MVSEDGIFLLSVFVGLCCLQISQAEISAAVSDVLTIESERVELDRSGLKSSFSTKISLARLPGTACEASPLIIKSMQVSIERSATGQNQTQDQVGGCGSSES